MPCSLFSLFLQRRHPLQKDYFHKKPFFSDNRVTLQTVQPSLGKSISCDLNAGKQISAKCFLDKLTEF